MRMIRLDVTAEVQKQEDQRQPVSCFSLAQTAGFSRPSVIAVNRALPPLEMETISRSFIGYQSCCLWLSWHQDGSGMRYPLAKTFCRHMISYPASPPVAVY